MSVVVTSIVAVVAGVALASDSTPTGTTTSTSSSTTTTTVPSERPQAGWTVASSSARGVMVDYRNISVDGVTFRALRLRARTTLLRWHVGTTDPNLAAKAPADAGPSIYWPAEGRAGVVAVFNGGFKQSAGAGGAMADGFVFSALMKSHMTIALDNAGHWSMGLWGTPNFPPAGFHAISYRQNLGALVWRAKLTPAARSANWGIWGSPLGNIPKEARSGLGVDAQGNLVYVATMEPILAAPLGLALMRAGVVTGMELDINPFWPIMGASFAPVRAKGGHFPVQLPRGMHSPNIYDSGWERDFFVALAEPANWSCQWQSPGLTGLRGRIQPQVLALVGTGCGAVGAPITTTTSTSTTSTTTSAG